MAYPSGNVARKHPLEGNLRNHKAAANADGRDFASVDGLIGLVKSDSQGGGNLSDGQNFLVHYLSATFAVVDSPYCIDCLPVTQ